MRSKGGLGGSAFIRDNWEALVEAGRRVAVVMVGPTPVTDDARIELMSGEFSEDQLRDLKLFQLRGVVTPEHLGFRQRLGIKTALAALRRKPERTPEEERMLETGGVDLTDREALGPLLRWIRREAWYARPDLGEVTRARRGCRYCPVGRPAGRARGPPGGSPGARP